MKVNKKTQAITALAVLSVGALTGATPNPNPTDTTNTSNAVKYEPTLSQVSVATPSSLLVTTEEKIAQLQSAINTKQGQIDQAEREKEQYKTALDNVSKELSGVESTLKDTTSELDSTKQSLEDVTASRDTEKERADNAEKRIKELEAKIASLQTEVDNLVSASATKEQASSVNQAQVGNTDGTGGKTVTSALRASVNSIDNAQRKAVVQAALSQLGKTQDCTMLVTNSLASIGINHHGWPESYTSLGTQVSRADAKPGDIIVWYDNGTKIMMGNGKVQQHVALVVSNDNGKITAVHGGWNGNTTALWSDQIAGNASTPIFISIDK